jgi:hypothetical protein
MDFGSVGSSAEMVIGFALVQESNALELESEATLMILLHYCC